MCYYDINELELQELAQGLVDSGKGLKDFEDLCVEYDITFKERPYFSWWFIYYATRNKADSIIGGGGDNGK